MIVGVDVSSKRVDLAWLDEQGRPQRWHQKLEGGKHDNHLIDRLRRIRIQWPYTLTHVAIEYPWARGDGIPALWSTMGVITRQVPAGVEVAWPEPKDLRAAIGARNTKESAQAVVQTAMYLAVPSPSPTSSSWHPLAGWDEHELDALVAAVGWGRILAAQDAT